MATPEFLIVGLGNPGDEYENTPHNVGFIALDRVADHYRAGGWQRKFRGMLSASGDGVILFFKPLTYMNLSGEAVREILQFYKLDATNIIVLHDDIDLKRGQIKVKQDGGSAGHNGIKSLDSHIGKSYWRIRLGVGRPEYKDQVTNYVLGKFGKQDWLWVNPMLDEAVSKVIEKMKDSKQFEDIKKIVNAVSDKMKGK